MRKKRVWSCTTNSSPKRRRPPFITSLLLLASTGHGLLLRQDSYTTFLFDHFFILRSRRSLSCFNEGTDFKHQALEESVLLHPEVCFVCPSSSTSSPRCSATRFVLICSYSPIYSSPVLVFIACYCYWLFAGFLMAGLASLVMTFCFFASFLFPCIYLRPLMRRS